jgi:hypothetical protein
VKTIPQIPQEAQASGAKFLKPESLSMKIGDRLSFTIRAAHSTGDYNGKKVYSLPVTNSKTGDGEFPLNKTNMGYLVKKLGDNSDGWLKHTFDAVCIPQKNPNTSAPVLSWTIDIDSIK